MNMKCSGKKQKRKQSLVMGGMMGTIDFAWVDCGRAVHGWFELCWCLIVRKFDNDASRTMEASFLWMEVACCGWIEQ